MSFWEDNKEGEKVIISEESIDVLMESFRKISLIYEENVGRKPLISEVEELIKSSLFYQTEQCVSDISSEEQGVSCKLKFKKVKRQPYEEGDFLIIPLRDNLFAYGIIVKGNSSIKSGVYIQYFDLFTDRPLNYQEVKKVKKENLFILFTGVTDIVNRKWRIIGKINLNQTTIMDFRFFGKIGERYYISEGEANAEKRKIVTKEEAEQAKNPDGLFGTEAACRLLFDIYKTKNRND